jgi:hypothetical protein
MHLVQILLPFTDTTGHTFPSPKFERLAQKLTEKFGGVTSFTRTPAEGRWKNRASTEHDDIAVIEIMTETLDRGWWADFRKRLEQEFDQEEIMIRCHQTEQL